MITSAHINCSFNVMKKIRQNAFAPAAACAVTVTFLVAATAMAVDQGGCEPAWQPFESNGQIGVDKDDCCPTVYALTEWNDDLIVGGRFETAGGQTVNRIARWDGKEWHPFTVGGEIGVDGPRVHDLTVWNGDLIAGGIIVSAGGETINHIAHWDGEAWHSFASGGQIGVGSTVNVVVVWNDDLIVGGHFNTAGGQTVNGIARWDGEVWHPLASGGQIGVAGGPVSALTVWNGDLIAGGSFTTAGGQTVNRIARWDGEAWQPFASEGKIGLDDVGFVDDLLVWNDDLIVGGFFSTAGGKTLNNIARWDGSAWHPFESNGQIGVDWDACCPTVSALTASNGDLIAGGQFSTAGGQTVNSIARWDGSAWHPYTSGVQIDDFDDQPPGLTRSMTVWKGDPIAGGFFTTAGGMTVNNIARWSTPQPAGPADLNCDGVVNVFDLIILIGNWGPCDELDDCPADITGPGGKPDGVVDVFDLIELISNWG